MKPERIEFGLRSLPGWVRDGRQGICRLYTLPNWRDAMILVDFSQRLGAHFGRHPRTEICAGQVVVRLPPMGSRRLQEADLEVARALASAEDATDKENIDRLPPEGEKA